MLGFTPGFSMLVSAATLSGRVALSTGGKTVVVYNSGAIPIYAALGGSTVTALSASATAKAACYTVPPGNPPTILTREPTEQTHLALKSTGVIVTAYVSTGEGKPT